MHRIKKNKIKNFKIRQHAIIYNFVNGTSLNPIYQLVPKNNNRLALYQNN